MFDAVVFSSVNALEFLEVRRNVVRIPEVIRRIREAQAIWDEVSPQNLDLLNFIGSDDSIFLGHLRLKNLSTAIIQLGLYERFLAQSEGTDSPRLMLGLVNGDSALKVVTRELAFEELIRQSPTLSAPRANLALQLGGLPVLSGISLAEFGLSEKVEGGYKPLLDGEMDLRKVMEALSRQEGVKKVVVIGPGAGHAQTMFKDVGGAHIEVTDSVDLDPVLSWFWPAKASAPLQVAFN